VILRTKDTGPWQYEIYSLSSRTISSLRMDYPDQTSHAKEKA
jgi:hypothetical protein